jgi:hypothetical protein
MLAAKDARIIEENEVNEGNVDSFTFLLRRLLSLTERHKTNCERPPEEKAERYRACPIHRAKAAVLLKS